MINQVATKSEKSEKGTSKKMCSHTFIFEYFIKTPATAQCDLSPRPKYPQLDKMSPILLLTQTFWEWPQLVPGLSELL